MTRATPGFLEALAALASALAEPDGPAMVIGGVAVIAQGVPRLTADVDATIIGASTPPSEAAVVLARHGIVTRIQDAVPFAEAHHVLLGVHEPSGIDIDLSFAWLPFEIDALDRREARDFAGVPIEVAHPEDLVIYKVIAARPKDVEDAEALMTIHAGRIDLNRVRRVVSELAAALEDDERPRLLERVIRKARP
jgi:hypothetical protein